MNKEWPEEPKKTEPKPKTLTEFMFDSSNIFVTAHYFYYVCMKSLVLSTKTLDGKCAGELVKCNNDFAFINFFKW